MNCPKRGLRNMVQGRSSNSHRATTAHSAILIHSVSITVTASTAITTGTAHSDSRNATVSTTIVSNLSFDILVCRIRGDEVQ